MNGFIVLLELADNIPIFSNFLLLSLRICLIQSVLLNRRQASFAVLLIRALHLFFFSLAQIPMRDVFLIRHGGQNRWQLVIFAFADGGKAGADFQVTVWNGYELGSQQLEVEAGHVFVFAQHGRRY